MQKKKKSFKIATATAKKKTSNTGCFIFTEIFQEPLIGTSNAHLLMTNASFSSQTWAILYLNETLIKSQYRTQSNDTPVRCQNGGCQQYLIKIHQKNIFFFTNLGLNLCFMKTMLCSMDSSNSEVFKNVLDVVFITSGTDLIRILRIVLL